jgi:hypothetical protein
MEDFFKSAEEVKQAAVILESELPSAECGEARKLLSVYMAVIEKYRNNENTLFSGRACSGEQVVYQRRLAHIARRQGQESDGKQHEADGVDWCKRAQWSSCTPPTIQRVVSEMNSSIKGRCF